jgi:hypothetical protein
MAIRTLIVFIEITKSRSYDLGLGHDNYCAAYVDFMNQKAKWTKPTIERQLADTTFSIGSQFYDVN